MIVSRLDAPLLSTEARYMFLLTFAICVVIPHSLQTVTAGLLVITTALCLLVMRTGKGISYVLVGYACSVIVTCIYIAVGARNGAPDEAITQAFAIYIISPLCWIIIWRTVLQLMPVERVVNYLIYLAFAACLTIALFFFLFLSRGAEAVTFFSSAANVDLREGYSAATLHVYGSMIFLCSAFFSTPELLPNKYIRVPFLIMLAVAAVTSGRSALILSIPIGLLFGIIIRSPDRRINIRGLVGGRQFKYLLLFGGAFAGVLLLNELVGAIDLTVILDAFWKKLAQGGGAERTSQAAALVEGIRENHGLGAGHGIGVALRRSDDFAWRYENVPLAIVFKTGFLGALIYAAPFLFALWQYASAARHKMLNTYDKFIFAGFVAVLVGAWTNPYLESFIFQWMFIFPMVYAEQRKFFRSNQTSALVAKAA